LAKRYLMPAESKSQQRLMGMVRAEQKGEDTGSAKAKEMAGKMDPGDVKDFAETSHKGLPEKKSAAEVDPSRLSAILAGMGHGALVGGGFGTIGGLSGVLATADNPDISLTRRIALPPALALGGAGAGALIGGLRSAITGKHPWHEFRELQRLWEEEQAEKEMGKLASKQPNEQEAFVDGFLTKCSGLGLSEDRVAQMVYGICRQDSEAADAFRGFVKSAIDLGSLPAATTPAPAPCRSAEAKSAPMSDRAKEVMLKKYASKEEALEALLACPVKSAGEAAYKGADTPGSASEYKGQLGHRGKLISKGWNPDTGTMVGSPQDRRYMQLGGKKAYDAVTAFEAANPGAKRTASGGSYTISATPPPRQRPAAAPPAPAPAGPSAGPAGLGPGPAGPAGSRSRVPSPQLVAPRAMPQMPRVTPAASQASAAPHLSPAHAALRARFKPGWGRSGRLSGGFSR